MNYHLRESTLSTIDDSSVWLVQSSLLDHLVLVLDQELDTLNGSGNGLRVRCIRMLVFRARCTNSYIMSCGLQKANLRVNYLGDDSSKARECEILSEVKRIGHIGGWTTGYCG